LNRIDLLASDGTGRSFNKFSEAARSLVACKVFLSKYRAALLTLAQTAKGTPLAHKTTGLLTRLEPKRHDFFTAVAHFLWDSFSSASCAGYWFLMRHCSCESHGC